MKVVILNRVSTDKQNFNRQSEELNTYCKEKGWEVVNEFSEVISGYTSNQLRVGLMEMMMFLKENKEVSKVVCWEIALVSLSTYTMMVSAHLHPRRESISGS